MKDDRERALDTIINVLEKGEYMSGSGNGYTGRVCRGVTERAIELDRRLGTISSMKIKRMHPVVRNVLRLGAYEILYMDSIPVSATVNEMVSLVKKRGQKRASGMVNAILRKVSGTVCEENQYKYSMPGWLYDRLKAFYPDKADDICRTFLKEQLLTMRINTSVVTVERMEQLFKESGISYEAISETVYRISDYESVEEIPGFEEGYWYIQNPSSTMPAKMADIRSGMKVLDMCAAPGGKTIHAADLCGSDGYVESRDISAKKVSRIRENIKRSPFSNIETKVWDATVFDEKSVETFDVVIADVPCSGVGVIGRKPEIKYRLKETDILQLVSIQKQILANASQYVKNNGRLVYSTCTILKEENSDQIKEFLNDNANFHLIEELQILPHDEWDGFYVCVMEKNAGTSLR